MTYRLLEVICQAVLVTEDEDGNLVKVTSQPTAVPVQEWPVYPQKLLDQIETLQLEQRVQ